MPIARTVHVDIRQALLATAAALADGGLRLTELAAADSAAAADRLVAAELALVDLASARAASADRQAVGPASARPALIALKFDRRDVEAFSDDWLAAVAPRRPRSAAWRLAHLVNAIDFGRWLVARSAAVLAANRGDDIELRAEVIRAILQLDMALAELTRACLGHRAGRLAGWTA